MAIRGSFVCSIAKTASRTFPKWVVPSSLAILASLVLSGCPTAYVGIDTCLTCHDGRYAPDRTGVKESAHAEVGCEACHGPGYLHVRNGGRGGLFIGVPANNDFCSKCHEEAVSGFAQSRHGEDNLFSCDECHDVHRPDRTRVGFRNNDLCLQCHASQGFDSETAITDHTFHPVDPEGTGASRCTACHMVPLVRVDQSEGPHGHSFRTTPPIASNEAAAAGITPVPPNTCAGITGCHDGTVTTSLVFDVDDEGTNAWLQSMYEVIAGT